MDPALPWEALEPEHVRAFWRRMAARYIETRGREFGMRAAEGVVDTLYGVAGWLREEHHIPPDAARPQEYWRKRLKDEWAQRTRKHRSKPHRPRHTPDEYRRIFAALNDARVDPRMRLAIELAGECRTGQVLRRTRTMLTLTEMDSAEYAALRAGSLGQVVIPGAGKKHGRSWSSRPSSAARSTTHYVATLPTTRQLGVQVRLLTTTGFPARASDRWMRQADGGRGASVTA